VKALRIYALAAVAGMLMTSTPVIAGPNDPVPGTEARDPRAPDLTLGMALMSAAVNFNGTLARGSGVIQVIKIAGFTGNYDVRFNRDVRDCYYLATIGNAGGGSTSGQINVAARAGAPNGVFVDTNDTAGAAADRSFHLLVFCNK
jgi:hypothetical protein